MYCKEVVTKTSGGYDSDKDGAAEKPDKKDEKSKKTTCKDGETPRAISYLTASGMRV